MRKLTLGLVYVVPTDWNERSPRLVWRLFVFAFVLWAGQKIGIPIFLPGPLRFVVLSAGSGAQDDDHDGEAAHCCRNPRQEGVGGHSESDTSDVARPLVQKVNVAGATGFAGRPPAGPQPPAAEPQQPPAAVRDRRRRFAPGPTGIVALGPRANGI